MKGVILAGGKGTRLYPLTKVTNKHLLPVGKEPMILNPIKKLTESGISKILIVTSTDHMGSIVNLLGSGKEYEAEFTYKVQDSASGIADALRLAEDFANGEKITVILGDNITNGSIKEYVKDFEKQEKGAKVLLKKVNDPTRFGIAAIDEKQVMEIEEKPDEPKSDFAVIGYYMYDSKVFDIIKEQKPSARGEYEITDVNNAYIKLNELTYDVLDGDWTDAGTFQSLLDANQIILKAENTEEISSPSVLKSQLDKMIDEEKSKVNELKKQLDEAK